MTPNETTSKLPCEEADPDSPAAATVLWLHGLGADGHDFMPIVPALQAMLAVPTRFVFPHAPHRAITINGGFMMRAWYDIADPDLARAEDADGIRSSSDQLEDLIRREIGNGIAAERIVLAGFSQGGAIALHCGLRHRERLAGILAMSTYLPLTATVENERHPANRDTPIFMAHGMEDTVVPVSRALASRKLLERLGYKVQWHCYDMAHSLCDREVGDIATWLNGVLSA